MKRKINVDLIEKFKSNKLDDKDKQNVNMLLNSMIVSKLRINFLILLVMTIIALTVEIFIDFLG